MTFEQRLAAAALLVEDRLAGLLSATSMLDIPERLLGAMRHGTLGQGKRFRPFLVLESAGLFGVPATEAVDAAAALELVHCYSLVHDDLPAMDNDALRRGAPTVWKAYDEWTGILAGDALLTLAFEILADPATHADADVRVELVGGLARAAGAAGMVGGQMLDLTAEKRGEPAHADAAHVRHLQAMKTGALIAYAVDAGAVLGRADRPQRAALAQYGGALGLAFQISDDLLDAEGDAAIVGKAVAKDAALGKATLVGLSGVAATRRMLDVAVADATAALASFGVAAAGLVAAADFMGYRRK